MNDIDDSHMNSETKQNEQKKENWNENRRSKIKWEAWDSHAHA